MMTVSRRYDRYRAALFSLFLAGTSLTGIAQASPSPMPAPQEISLSGGDIPLPHGIRLQWEGKPTPLLKRAEARFMKRFAALTGRHFPAGPAYVVSIRMGQDPAYLTVKEKESYTLTVTGRDARLEADGPAGALHGLATVLQLLENTPQGVTLAQGRVTDAPRFAWRGLLLDSSRHFISLPTLERQLDAMELVKLNVLHWHLSDDRAFRVESRAFPRLKTEAAATGGYYTQAQIREIVAYAADRGIRIVPEFDLPGHARAIARAYPALLPSSLQAKGKDLPHSIALDPVNPQTLRFAQTLYKEMGGLFPDRYFHTGGDEIPQAQWTDSPAIAAYMKRHDLKDASALQGAFTAQLETLLSRQNKIMMGWDELTEAPLPKRVVVESWRASRWTGSATGAGHPVVVSVGYYLDQLWPFSAHYRIDPYDTRAVGLTKDQMLQARARPTPMLKGFLMDPQAPALDAQQRDRVMGGEAALWTEIVSDAMVDARLWPRLAAVAERFWSAASVIDDEETMERRLSAVLAELEATGLKKSFHEAALRHALVPRGDETPLTVLTQATVPVRNYALNHMATYHMGLTEETVLTAPVAVAAPDSAVSSRFNRLARRYVRGDKSVAASLRGQLEIWAENDRRFSALAGDNPLLKEVLPVSHALSLLARDGLKALEGSGDAAWRKEAQERIRAEEKAFEASSTMVLARKSNQPPGGLLIAFLPGIKTLVENRSR